MKKYKNILIITVIIWIVAIILWLSNSNIRKKPVDDHFPLEAEIIQNEEKVGANIWLLQAIHGVDGIDYRYAIETDCPKWDFKTRYVTSTPIDWVNETSAVEVIIYDTQVRYQGTVYASGQYYTVPLLGNLSSENISLEEWKDNLVIQAYQIYQTDNKLTLFGTLIKCVIFYMPFIFIVLIININKKKRLNK